MRRSGERRKAIKCKDKEHARYRTAVRVFLRDVERWAQMTAQAPAIRSDSGACRRLNCTEKTRKGRNYRSRRNLSVFA